MESDSIVFTESHLQSFRHYSKDENPLHIDSEYAARTPFAERVLYGIATVFYLLSKINLDKKEISSLRVDFKKPVFLNKTYQFSVEQDEKQFILKLLRGDALYTVVKITITAGTNQQDSRFSFVCNKKNSLLEQNPNWNTIPGFGKLDELLSTYPGLQSIPQWLLQMLAWSSYWVGMVAPGKQALYSQLRLDFKDNNLIFNFESNQVHNLLKQYKSTFTNEAGSKISMVSFSRPEPVSHLNETIFNNSVDSSLENHWCFVTGGTRGIGSIFSQILSSMDAKVLSSFFRDEKAARTIEEFILSKGKSFKAIKSDKLSTLNNELKGKKLDCLILNAVPSIKQIDSSELPLEELQKESERFYNLTVGDLEKLAGHLAPDATIINVSTTYIDEKPEGFAHYYEAKKAIEEHLKDYSQNNPKLTVLNFRLPKMHTDQTNTNNVNDIALSPLEVIGKVTKDYLSAKGKKGFYSFEYNEERQDA